MEPQHGDIYITVLDCESANPGLNSEMFFLLSFAALHNHSATITTRE